MDDIAVHPLKLSRFDYAILAIFSLLLFGYSGISGRPLTMHEARLPETSREMKAAGEWLLPHSGIRPWLERPPLPHWIVISAMKIFHRDDSVWVVRFPSAVMGIITVLLTAWMANRLFGRTIAMLSGLVLASSFEFYQYSGYAEDDIYLATLVAVCMAVFVRSEFEDRSDPKSSTNFFTWRRWEVIVFFVAAGLTNLTKGPLLGLVVIGSTTGAFLLWNGFIDKTWRPLFRYVWLWGWIATIAIGAAWPVWAYHRYPDVLANWKYDYLGRMSGTYSDINQPWYYYAVALSAALAPWSLVCLLGLFVRPSASFGLASRSKALRFLWCWAVCPLLIFSIPKGKHHHYLIPFLAPWAIFGAIGLVKIGDWLRMTNRRRTTVVAAIMSILLIGYCIGDTAIAPKTDHTVDDTAFLNRAKTEIPDHLPLYINGKLGKVGNLDFFRIQFYSRGDAILLHNLSYLRDETITDEKVFVITRARDQSKLEQLGMVKIIDQSAESHDMPGPVGRFTLFELVFRKDLQRYPAPRQITNMQAMERDLSGPWCGPPL